jgi:uncharacterized protein
MWALEHAGDALRLAGIMFWAVLWPLTLGFLLSAMVSTLVSKRAIARVLGRDAPRSAALATAFGAASSSCSYAAVAVARTLFRSGATLTNAIVFEFASTNLVFELGLALVVLLGWQFLSAEAAGGLLMVALLAVVLPRVLRGRVVAQARVRADRGARGRMEGHAAMDMSVSGGSFAARLFSPRGFTGISHNFFMDVYSVWSDLVLGFVIAGALAAWVPNEAWRTLFLSGHGGWSVVWGAVVGPLIALLSFVCSVGNVPVAAVLWSQGISFAGVIAFIFGDLLIIPILNIYRKYYGLRTTAYIGVTSYAAMVVAGLAVGAVFDAVGIAPTSRQVAAFGMGIELDFNTILDILALLLIAALGYRFVRTGGLAMLREMDHAGAEPSSVMRHP